MQDHPSDRFEDFLSQLSDWFGGEMAALYGMAADPGNGLLMGCPVWGEAYVNRFAWYCVPSLLAPQNLAALRNNSRLVLFTDRASYPRLWEVLRGLEAETGIDVIIREIPFDIMNDLAKQPKTDPIQWKYWVLGVAGQVSMQMAGRWGMAWHMLMPDHCYGEAYFPNLFRIANDYEAIAQPGISADVEKASASLYAFKSDRGALVIPDRDLGDIGWQFLHPQTKACLITDDAIPDNLPLSHLWIWQGQDRLYLSCCHMNAAYLSARMCAQAPSRIPATIDAELPAFFPRDFYVPKAEDGLTYLELSDSTKPHSDQRGGIEAFVACCSEKVRYSDDWTPFAKHLYEIPIHTRETYVEEAKVRHQHAWLLAQLRDDNPSQKARAAYRFIQSLAFR